MRLALLFLFFAALAAPQAPEMSAAATWLPFDAPAWPVEARTGIPAVLVLWVRCPARCSAMVEVRFPDTSSGWYPVEARGNQPLAITLGRNDKPTGVWLHPRLDPVTVPLVTP